MNRRRNRRFDRAPARRRAVILLVMLGLLSLFTLIAVTFVVASGQFRRGAAAAASAERMGDPFDTLLHQALMQVARGSNHPHSAIGHHSLLEDMYGNGDAVTGCCFIDASQIGGTPPLAIYTTGGNNMTIRAGRTQPYKGMPSPVAAPMLIEIGALSFGWDREPGIALADDNVGTGANGIVDDISEVPDRADAPLAGDDCFLGATYAHPAMVGEDPANWPQVWQNKTTSDGLPLPIIDNIDNYYAGRVITFVNGDAAGQSSYIVRSKLVPVNPNTNANLLFRTILYIQPFPNGAQPSHKDRFVINGRAFNGTGFGYNPYIANGNSLAKKPAVVSGAPNPALRALDMPYSEPFIRTPAVDGTTYGFDVVRSNRFPISLLPNPVDGGIRDYLNRYNPIIDGDEDYDAPDEQNMLLSYSVWVPPLNSGDPGRYRTIMPSLHRPDLVKFFTYMPGMAVAKPSSVSFPRWHDVPPHVRRRYILRPDPSDHYDWTQEPNAPTPQNSDGWTPGEPFQDVNGNGQWDPVTVRNGAPGPAEPYIDIPNPDPNNTYDIGDRAYYNTGFDAMDGPWDVDNDNDNLPDSIWVDLGAPVTTAPDGRIVKPMFAILVRDLDGRINVNAHGTPKHYDRLEPAFNPYTPGTKPSDFQTLERVRIGAWTYAMYQLQPNVAWNTTDVIRTHTAGDPDPTRDVRSFRDVPFQYLWALPYLNDAPFHSTQATTVHPRTNPANRPTFYDPLVPQDSQTVAYLPHLATSVPDRIPDVPYYNDGTLKLTYQVYRGNRGGPRPLMFDLRGASNSTGTAIDHARLLRGFEPAVGQGFSVADVNFGPISQTSIWGHAQLPSSVSHTTATIWAPYNYYRVLLEGRPHDYGPGNGTVPPRAGRYGESYLLPPALAGQFPGIQGPRAGVTDTVLFYAPYLNDATINLPSAAQMAPQRGDDNYPASPTRFQAPSNDNRFVRGNAYRESFMPVPSAQLSSYYVHVPIPADPRLSPSKAGVIVGDYGTPGDIDGDGFVALDVRGQPIYHNMGTANETIDDPTEINLHRRYFAQTYFGVLPNNVSRAVTNVPMTTDIDAPYTPAELERLLRARDAGSDTLPGRLVASLRGDGENGDIDNYDMRRAVTSEQWDVPCPHVAPTPELAAAMRALNLPLNNPSLSDLLRARFYLATGQAASAGIALKAARLSTIAMRSYRWQISTPTDLVQVTDFSSRSAEYQVAFPGRANLSQLARRRWHTRLLSPDLGQGLRMDINAPFGNGYDEDPNLDQGNGVFEPTDPPGIDPNGVVDEPMEWYGTVVNNAHGSIFNTFVFDGNRDGNYSPQLDEEPRQQFAKELYCLMMLLIDQNYVEPLPTSVAATSTASGAVATSTFAPGAETNIRMVHNPMNLKDPTTPNGQIYPYIDDPAAKTRRWLTARRMAQWAINVVDFRDRDSIMTPFEFDADPFHDNDGDTNTESNLAPHLPRSNGTWDVDGYLLPDNLLPPTIRFEGPLPLGGDTDKVWRGVVWGCEYPDLLLTETAAFHNRRTQNLMSVTTGTNYLTFDNGDNKITDSAVGADTDTNDATWDQRRIPQGTALFELYATGNPNNPALPRELYTFDATAGELFLDLGRTASKTILTGSNSQTFTYPVWRLAITESHYQNNSEQPVTDEFEMHLSIADRLREFPATCSLDLRDQGMSILSRTNFTSVTTTAASPSPAQLYVPIERVVTFLQGNPTATTLNNAKAGLISSSGTNGDIEVYVNTTSTAHRARVLPGDYVVVGPGRDSAVAGGVRNVTCIGNTRKKMIVPSGMSSTTLTDYNNPQSIIDMGDPDAAPPRLFLHTSPNGVDEYPLSQIAPSSLTGLVRMGPNHTTDLLGRPSFLQIRPPVSVPCMVTIAGGARRVGLNISEPLATLPASERYPDPDTTTKDDWLATLEETDAYTTVYNEPLDENMGSNNHNPHLPHSPTEEEDRTLLNYKTVFLQRLADPTRGWDQYTNPYLTLDWMPIDLTIFNGEPHYVYRDPPTGVTWKKDITLGVHLNDPAKEKRSPAKPANASQIPSTALRFGSRQRGGARTPFRGNFSYYDLWSQPDWLDTSVDADTRPPLTGPVKDSTVKYIRTTGGAISTQNYYNCAPVRWQDPFDHTFGYLNLPFHTMRAPTTTNRASLPMQQAPHWIASAASFPDSVNKPWLRMSPVREPLRRPFGGNDATLVSGWFTGQDLGGNTRYIGSPRRPFNWLTWNNRPFAGAMELMLVPASSPSRLLHEYSMRQTTAPTAPEDNSTSGPFANRYAPFSGRRAANHYMPAVRVPDGTVSSGHNAPAPDTAASVYSGNFMAGFISKPPFGHLLNFFESSNAVGMERRPDGSELPIPPTNGWAQQPAAANFYRLFEFVNVPSRMAGTRTPHYHGLWNQAQSPANISESHGWPFMTPFNLFSSYREPGRVNINTIIPLNPKTYARESSGNVHHMTQVTRNERMRDDGASIWRAVTNDFHPNIRWLVQGSNDSRDLVDNLGINPWPPFPPTLEIPRTAGSYQQVTRALSHQRQMSTSTLSGQTNTRAGFMQAAADVTHSPYVFNPSEDTVANFYSAYASMFKDDPNSDPRGPNGVYENLTYWSSTTGVVFSDDRLMHPFWNFASPAGLSRHDGTRPSMFSNPFRSFMEDFSATPPGAPVANKRYSAFQVGGANLPLLAVDATLLRRRDTTWNPWHTHWLPDALATDLKPVNIPLRTDPAPLPGQNRNNLLFGPPQIDPRFDPLFALNYPRPFRMRSTGTDIFSDSGVAQVLGTKPAWWCYSGFTASMGEYVGTGTATKSYTYGTVTVDAIRVKDTDYRNTDRNPFFRYQLYTKLSNTLTTRSNVYAIWVTVGYFECERVQPGVPYPVQTRHSTVNEFAAKHRYPDGYRILRELGSDNGEAVRHRAFAILDRTIPVGFLRGENLNVDRCFLIKRIVE